MEKNGVLRRLRLSIIVMYLLIASIYTVHTDATKRFNQYRARRYFKSSSKTKWPKKFHTFRKYDDMNFPLDDFSNTDTYGSSPFSSSPYYALPPFSFPGNTPPFCVYPPNIPQPPSTTPSPIGGYTPLPPPGPIMKPPFSPNPPQITPIPIPPTIVPSPPSTFPNPPSILPSPPSIFPNPPSIVPSPPSIIPYPPSIVPSPPNIFPNPPSIVPSPPNIFPNPPSIVPSPPSVFPNPPSIVPNPPNIFPNPPSTIPSPLYYEPSPPISIPSPVGTIPSPRFLPPVAFPPPPTPRGVSSPAMWCVARTMVRVAILREAMNYACGSGADCEQIQPSGSCFEPNNYFSHASYAFNSYWQRTKRAGATCDFGGTAILITVDPSYDGCHFLYF